MSSGRVYRRIRMVDLSQTQFRQIAEIEENCGLEPYPPGILVDCIENLDTFACFEDNRVVGFLTVQSRSRYLDGSLYIVNLNVDSAFRGQVIAKGLMYALWEYHIRDHGDKLVSLDVAKTNQAMELYKKVGFQIMDMPSRNGDTDVVMAVSLAKLGENLRCYDAD